MLVKKAADRCAVRVAALCLTAYWVLYTSYWWGNVGHPSSIRFFALFAVALSVLAALGLSRIPLLQRRPWVAVLLASLMLALHHPTAVEDRFFRTQLSPRKYRSIMSFLGERTRRDMDFLVVTTRPGTLTVHEMGAVYFDRVREDARFREEFRDGLYGDVYVVQDILFETGLPSTKTSLPPGFVLRSLREFPNSGKRRVRISELVRIENKA